MELFWRVSDLQVGLRQSIHGKVLQVYDEKNGFFAIVKSIHWSFSLKQDWGTYGRNPCYHFPNNAAYWHRSLVAEKINPLENSALDFNGKIPHNGSVKTTTYIISWDFILQSLLWSWLSPACFMHFLWCRHQSIIFFPVEKRLIQIFQNYYQGTYWDEKWRNTW